MARRLALVRNALLVGLARAAPACGPEPEPDPAGVMVDTAEVDAGVAPFDAAAACPAPNPCWSVETMPAGGCRVATAPLGTPCDDEDPCSAASACDGEGRCLGAPCDGVNWPCPWHCPAGCDDGNDCTSDVLLDSGLCRHDPVAADSPCEAGSGACRSQGTCDAAGQCALPAARIGTPCPASPCRAGACSAAGHCEETGVADGTVCHTPSPTCDKAGDCVCVQGTCTPLPGSPCKLIAPKPCRRGVLFAAGACLAAIEPDGAACEVGAPTLCRQTTGTCLTGECQLEPQPAGTTCKKGVGTCAFAGSCDGSGSCLPGVSTEGQACTGLVATACGKAQCVEGTCQLVESQPGTGCTLTSAIDCHQGVCGATGLCEPVPLPAGAICTAGTGSCQTVGACDGAGWCSQVSPPSKLGQECASDSNPCVTMLCAANGECLPQAKPGASCQASSSTCLKGVCDAQGFCAETAVVGAPCVGTGDVCHGPGTCAADGTCQEPVLLDKACGAAGPCHEMRCAASGKCEKKPLIGVPCKDTKNPCLTGQCDALGQCADAKPVAGGPCGAQLADPCHTRQCTATGTCELTVLAGQACKPKDPCRLGTCSADGQCLAGAPAPGKACSGWCQYAGVCDDAGQCQGKPKPAGAWCSPGVFDNDCVQSAACDGKGACVATFLPVGTPCDAYGDACFVSGSAGKCGPTGLCEGTYLPEGAPCGYQGKDACVVAKACRGGRCRGVVLPDVCAQGCPTQECWMNGPSIGHCEGAFLGPCGESGSPCMMLDCDPNWYVCKAFDLTAACDDGDACTEMDHCMKGGCVPELGTNCDDEKPCTLDSCLPSQGCLHAATNEGGPCGTGRVCKQGQCILQ